MFKKNISIISSLCLIIALMMPLNVQGLEQGKIYKASVSGMYYHPVTNEVLDQASSDNYAIGESMVKNIVQSVGQFEVSNTGSTYFTFRLGMMNFSNNQSFQIQTYGSSSWSTVSATVTNSGTIASGTTKDFVVSAPSTSCIVKVSMYVEPMGREVVFFVVPSNVVESDSTGMVATKVTTKVETVEPPETNDNTSSNQSDNTVDDEVDATDTNNEEVVEEEVVEEEVVEEEIVEEEIIEEQDVEDEMIEVESTNNNVLMYGSILLLLSGSIGGFVFYKYKKGRSTLNEVNK